jgi:hypothetical protein
MKVCAHCGAVYQNHVEFCFGDGEVLTAAPAGAPLEASDPASLDPRVDAQTLELMKRVEQAVVASVKAARLRVMVPRVIRPLPTQSSPWRLPLILGCMGVGMGLLLPLIGGSVLAYWVGDGAKAAGLP